MKDYSGWTDYLDKEKINSDGEFNLYRNYSDSQGRYYFSTYNEEEKLSKMYLFNEKPIARGITAYFACNYYNINCLYELLKNGAPFKRNKLFSKYFELKFNLLKAENERSVSPTDEGVLFLRFLSDHLQNEINKLKESQNYFNNILSPKDNSLKEELYKYALAYIDWIKEKESRLKSEKAAPVFERSNKINVDKLIDNLTNTVFWNSATLIPHDLKEEFKSLLNGTHVQSKIRWVRSQWMVYVIIEYFIKFGIIKISQKEIPDFLLKEFMFNSDTSRKKLKDNRFNTERLAGSTSKFTSFTKKLKEICESLSV